jgi:hypothetical protein
MESILNLPLFDYQIALARDTAVSSYIISYIS